MKRLLTGSIVLLLLVVSTVSAVVRADSQTPEPTTAGPFVFTAVDAVENVRSDGLVLRGVLDGTPQPTELQFSFADGDSMRSCEKKAMLSMDRPGRYALQIGYDLHINRFICRLTRR